MPSFEINFGLSNLPNLDDYDIDEHLSSKFNSNYHTLQKLSTFSSSENGLSLFRMKIRSLTPFLLKHLFCIIVSINEGPLEKISAEW